MLSVAILILVLLPIDAIAQSTSISSGYSSAMHPRLGRSLRNYLSELPLLKSEAARFVEDGSYFTYAGGDSVDLGISAHEFPNGHVVLGIQTRSPGLPVTDNALKSAYSGVGDDWYVVHFNPSTGETFFASYFGTDAQDWLSPIACDDLSGRCMFSGGTQGAPGIGKSTAGPSSLFIAIFGFIDPVTLQADFEFVCDNLGLDPSNAFSNYAYFVFLPFFLLGDDLAKSDEAAVQLGAGICGFRETGNRINGIVAIINPNTCVLENVLESTFETDDTFFGCYADIVSHDPVTGKDDSPFVGISAVGIRDNDTDFAVAGPTTPTYCYARANDTTMVCSDMPAQDPVGPSGKTVARVENDQYLEIEQHPELGTFALGWNTESFFGFMDYWPTIDPAVVSSEAPLRVGTALGLPLGLSLSPMGRASFTTDLIQENTFFGRQIGTYVVINDAAGDALSKKSFGGLDFLNWTNVPGGSLTSSTFDLDDHPFMKGYSGVAFAGIETSATAIQDHCPGGTATPCAVYGQVGSGLSYVSTCNMTDAPMDVAFGASSPEGGSECCGLFFDITDSGSVEPNSCSRMWPWPAEGGFTMDVTPSGGSPIQINSSDGLTGPFTTVIVGDSVNAVDVNDMPTVPRTYAIYFTNTLEETVDLTVYSIDGSLYSTSLDPLEASVFNVEVANLGTTVYVMGSTPANGDTEVISLNLPASDFVMQSVVSPGTGGKRKAFDILVFDALGTLAATQVVTAGEADVELPQSHALHANYPNPFNPSTMISFDLPEPSPVLLEIVNIYGQRVKRWVFDSRAAGTHSVAWNGRNSNGVLVASGVYLYSLTAGDYRQSRKMTLLR